MAGVIGPVTLDEAEAIAEMMVMTGRAVPAGRWVDSLREKAREERLKNLPHNTL